MIQKAVIDRFEEDIAVLLIGDGERRVEIHRTTLPEGCEEGTWLKVDVEGVEVKKMEIDLEETSEARNRIAEKLAKRRRGQHR